MSVKINSRKLFIPEEIINLFKSSKELIMLFIKIFVSGDFFFDEADYRKYTTNPFEARFFLIENIATANRGYSLLDTFFDMENSQATDALRFIMDNSRVLANS